MWFLFTSFALHSLWLKNIQSWDITLIYQNCLSPDHQNSFQLFYYSSDYLKIFKKLIWYKYAHFYHIWSLSVKVFLVIFAFNRQRPLRLVGFSSTLVGGRLLGPPAVIPSLVKIGWKLKFFTCYVGEGAVRPAAPGEGRSLAATPAARYRLPFPRSHTHKAVNFLSPETWVTRRMKLPQPFHCWGDSSEIWHTHKQWLGATIN